MAHVKREVMVKVYPSSGEEKIDVTNKKIVLYLREEARGGKCNAKARKIIAKLFSAPEEKVFLVRGFNSQQKRFVIYD